MCIKGNGLTKNSILSELLGSPRTRLLSKLAFFSYRNSYGLCKTLPVYTIDRPDHRTLSTRFSTPNEFEKLKITNFKDQLLTFTCHEEKQHQQSRVEVSGTKRCRLAFQNLKN
jgi:hypothetical protein